ncbi:hypothetical protein L208DRAFT_1123844, partial [Tricholoma matsutake]
VILWTTPHSLEAHALLNHCISPCLQRKIFKKLLSATSDVTHQSYGAGLLHFTQFCNCEHISETCQMPASIILLSSFIADAIGTCTGQCIHNWLNGVRLWHLYNCAEWHGPNSWITSLSKSADKEGVPFKQPPQNPLTLSHLATLQHHLDLSSPVHAAIWFTALAAFWGCWCLGKLLICSAHSFSPIHDTTCQTQFSMSWSNSHKVITFHLVWTKTTGIHGGECILTATNDLLCPIWALKNHLCVNNIAVHNAPLCAFRFGDTWSHLTKDKFLHITSDIYNTANLNLVLGHSYCIGGSVELLSIGVTPEVIMKLGGWSSLCFLLYWHCLELIIPAAITHA